MSAAFPWFGGKATPRIRNAVIAALPPHSRYVEPFGGGASILLSKPAAEVEVYNDVDRGLVSFFRCIADPERFPRFLDRVQAMPFSRELWEECNRTWVAIHDPVEQAARWYYVARCSFSGSFGSAWGAATDASSGGMSGSVARWLHALQDLPVIHARMVRVQIECCDWRIVLDRYAGPGWLAYCDPPYVLGARRSGGYAHELQDEDHEELVETLLRYNGAVVLSGYRTPLYRPLEDAGWESVEIPVVCSAAGRTRASGLRGAGAAKAAQSRVEVIWRNHEAMQRLADART